jgi:hypothetical protein
MCYIQGVHGCNIMATSGKKALNRETQPQPVASG